MKPNRFLLALVLILAASCSSDQFQSSINGVVLLKDKSVLTYGIDVHFTSEVGVAELNDKKEKINHAIRIILRQRERKQISNPARLVSVVKKIFNSQLNSKVTKIKVKEFKLSDK